MPAGAGTPHTGVGRCSRHGGCSPTHVKAAAREQALSEARALGLGGQLEVRPEDALVAATQVAAANLSVWQRRLAELDGAPWSDVMEAYDLQRDAVDRLGRWWKAALDAGVPAREALISERTGAALATLFQRVVRAGDVEPAARECMLAVLVEGLEGLERTPVDELAIEAAR